MEDEENLQSQYLKYEADEIDAGRFDAGEYNDLSPTHFSPSVASESFSQVSENENRYPLVEGDDINADDLEVDEIAADDFHGKENAGYEGIDIMVPRPGMKFKDENENFEFYKKYAYQVRFPSRRTTSHYYKFFFKARVTACSEIGGTWRINTVYLEHNHRINPSKSRLYRCNSEISARIRRQLEINDIAGIPLHKGFNFAVVEADGYDEMSCVEKDCRNFIDKVRRLRLGEGDATAIQTFFSRMQTSTPGFYFSIDLDEDCRLRNVFWVDNRCREAYKEFGDVVTFDTTYLTNKYDMPFAPFVGTWLECMHGQAPNGIIMDQDRAMQNAIEIVFPNTRHGWCLWHILKKLPEKFGNHRHKNSSVSSVHGLVYDTQSPPEFEEKWHTMLVRYEL
ncbi:protein FAR-RED IMPAIRED RESPONSE 1-like [Olea europaea var. sylvestris]|uniref:protein FAR-RED IMPAIRED RESPONSE 1-like n=1 Tax=Olea europaea var. sylvestris TaxID=158386 RepID=UPI000C1D5B78|nr:protein FAR-RED IMPAIRED RESPONSE 1-like [Olea europaea var. sylvestris]